MINEDEIIEILNAYDSGFGSVEDEDYLSVAKSILDKIKEGEK